MGRGRWRIGVVIGAVAVSCLLLAALVVFVLGPRRGQSFSSVATVGPENGGLMLFSEAFADGEPVPARYTCQGENISPPLAWNDPPQGTRSFALIMEDPDAPAGIWVHWVLYNLPAEMRSLPAGFQPFVESPARFARNSWGRREYGGPCPPSGTHRYVFQLYALDVVLTDDIADKAALLQAMADHVLAYAELTGTYHK